MNSPALQPTPQEWVIKDTFLLLQSIEIGVTYAQKHLEKPVPDFPMTSRLQNGKSLDFPQTYSSVDSDHSDLFETDSFRLRVCV